MKLYFLSNPSQSNYQYLEMKQNNCFESCSLYAKRLRNIKGNTNCSALLNPASCDLFLFFKSLKLTKQTSVF